MRKEISNIKYKIPAQAAASPKAAKINLGFTLIEMMVYLGVAVIVISAIMIFGIAAIRSGAKIKSNANLIDNGRRVMEVINYEIKKSRTIYTPTSVFDSHPGQLSLEQTSTSTPGEIISFVDFFQCGDSLCLRRDGSNPLKLTTGEIKITNLIFRQLVNSTSSPSVQINLGLETGTMSQVYYGSSIDLESAANLRGY